MDLHRKQEVTVGVLVLGGIALFLAGTMWLQGKSFGRGQSAIQVSFADAGTLKRGSAVRVSGVNLGSVEEIDFRGVGDVVVTLALSPQVEPKSDATAELATVGLVADAVINFNPGRAPEPLPAGQVIQGSVARGLMDIGGELGASAQTALGGINEIANRRLADNLNATLEAMQRLATVFSNTRTGPAAELTATMASLQQLSARLDTTLAQVDLATTLRKSDTLLTNLALTSSGFTATGARLDTLLQKINRGDGTMGKLVNDTLLYNDLRRVSVALEELVNEIKKNPGKITIQIKAF